MNVLTTCQKLINDALRNYLNDFIIVYLNDILIYSKILKKYMKHVSLIIKCLNAKNLLFKKKYEFH